MKYFYNIPFWVIPVSLVFCLTTVWMRLKIIQINYSINMRNKEIIFLQNEIEDYKLKVADLKRPDRLQKLAQEVFHMKPVEIHQRISLNE